MKTFAYWLIHILICLILFIFVENLAIFGALFFVSNFAWSIFGYDYLIKN